MIEIGIALAAATKSVELIRQGVKLGSDVKSLNSEFEKFCNFKEQIAEAKREQNSDEYFENFTEAQIKKHSREMALAEMEAKRMETSIRNAFFSANQMDVYFKMLEYEKAAKLKARRARNKKNKKSANDELTGKDIQYIMLFFLFSVAVIGGVIFMIIIGEANAQSWWETFQLLEEGPSSR